MPDDYVEGLQESLRLAANHIESLIQRGALHHADAAAAGYRVAEMRAAIMGVHPNPADPDLARDIALERLARYTS